MTGRRHHFLKVIFRVLGIFSKLYYFKESLMEKNIKGIQSKFINYNGTRNTDKKSNPPRYLGVSCSQMPGGR